MGQWTKARIQLCGRFVSDIDGSRIEDTLPGRIGRVLFAYLVLSRGRPVPRDKLLMAGWGEDAPAEAGNALSVQLSRLRHGLGAGHLRGRAEVELLLPPAIFVDAEAALEGAHRAESSIAEGRWAQAPPPHGSARAPRQRRRSAPRLRETTSPAPGGTRDRARPRRARRPPATAEQRRPLEPLGLREDILARHVASQLRVQDPHMTLRVPPQLLIVIAPDDIPAHANDPQRHRQPPGQPAAIVTPGH